MIPFSLLAQEVSFEQAIKAQESGKYQESINIYNQLIDNNTISESVFLNGALAASKNEDYVAAIIFVEKGLRQYPNSTKLLQNQKVINRILDSDILPIEEFFLVKLWKTIYTLLSSGVWSILMIICIIAMLILISIRWFEWYSMRKGVVSKLLITCGIVAIISLASASAMNTYEQSQDVGIVLHASTLKSGPEDRSESKLEIQAGEKVMILDQIGEWCKISLSNKQIGWLNKKNLETI